MQSYISKYLTLCYAVHVNLVKTIFLNQTSALTNERDYTEKLVDLIHENNYLEIDMDPTSKYHKKVRDVEIKLATR